MALLGARESEGGPSVLLVSTGAGLAFGLILSLYTLFQSKKVKVPEW